MRYEWVDLLILEPNEFMYDKKQHIAITSTLFKNAPYLFSQYFDLFGNGNRATYLGLDDGVDLYYVVNYIKDASFTFPDSVFRLTFKNNLVVDNVRFWIQNGKVLHQSAARVVYDTSWIEYYKKENQRNECN